MPGTGCSGAAPDGTPRTRAPTRPPHRAPPIRKLAKPQRSFSGRIRRSFGRGFRFGGRGVDLEGVLHRPGVIDLLGSQYWVAHVRQLRALGVGRSSVSRSVGRKTITHVAHGVVGITGQWNSLEGRCMVAQLVGGSAAYLSGTTAARLYGLRRMPETPVRVTANVSHPVRLPAWAVLVRSSWSDEEPRPGRSDRLRLSSPRRMLFDLAATLPDARFAAAAEDAWHLGLVTPAEADAYLQRVRRGGRTGVARFERWLDSVGTTGQQRPSESGLEQLLADLARRAGLPSPTHQHQLRLADGRTIRLDLAWPDVRFAIEPGHSWWHGGDLGQRADQERDRACSAVGWHVVRYDESVWDRIDETIAEIAAMYQARRRDVG